MFRFRGHPMTPDDEPCAIVGDIEAFFTEIESGQAAARYDALLAKHRREWATYHWGDPQARMSGPGVWRTADTEEQA